MPYEHLRRDAADPSHGKYLSISGGLLSDGGGGGVEQWSAIDAGPRQVWALLFACDGAIRCPFENVAFFYRSLARSVRPMPDCRGRNTAGHGDELYRELALADRESFNPGGKVHGGREDT